MTIAVLIHPYRCAPDGHTVMDYREGDVLTGAAAEYALADGAGFVPVDEPENKATQPPETQATTRRRGRKVQP